MSHPTSTFILTYTKELNRITFKHTYKWFKFIFNFLSTEKLYKKKEPSNFVFIKMDYYRVT